MVFSQRNGKILKVESLTGKEVWSLDLGFFSQQEFVLGGQTLLVPTFLVRPLFLLAKTYSIKLVL